LYSSKYIVLVIKAGRIAGMEVVRHAHGTLVGKSEWRSLTKRWCRWEDNIKN
jgi:hypothetical protein